MPNYLTSTLLDVPEYDWKRLNYKPFTLYQGSQYASLSYIFDRFLNALI